MIPNRRTALFVLVLALTPTLTGIARAEEDAIAAAGRQLRTLKAWGATHPACDGWTDSCALCARRADGSLGCSRIGVDCAIEAIQCTQLARDPKTGKTPPPPQQ